MKSRVLIVSPIYPPEIGGPASYVPELAKRLSRSRPVTVVTFCSRKPVETPEFSLVWVRLDGHSIVRQLRLLVATFQSAIKSGVIYAQGTLTVGLASVLVGKLLSKSVILKFVGDEVWEHTAAMGDYRTMEEFYTFPSKTLTLKLHRWTLKSASTVVVPSMYLKDFLVSAHGLLSDKIAVIDNPVVLPKSKDRLKSGLIYVGRAVPWKRGEAIIEAWKQIPRRQRPELRFVGDGPSLIAWQQAGVGEEKLEFLGSRPKPEVHELVSQSKALILYSTYEGQPHVILEALALGTPIIASDIPPHRELSLRFPGWITLVDSPRALSKAMASPPKHPTALPQLDSFEWSAHTRELNSVFKG